MKLKELTGTQPLSGAKQPEGGRRALGLAVVLALLSFALFSPSLRHDFVVMDDLTYVVNNPQVQSGMTWETLRWAFSTFHFSNWHPLTWISHALDCALYRLLPSGHHLTNITLHAVNTALLFLLLVRWTGRMWCSLTVGALFSWHPLHVESVAWVSERKDLLSAFFLLLSLFAYTRYAERRTWGAYVGTLVLFAAGLMSKPMLVTLPFLLLLIDFWPLQRAGLGPLSGGVDPAWRRLCLEKIPFFALSAASCWVTLRAQSAGGSVSGLESLGLMTRLLSSAQAYALYLVKTVLPLDLCVFYPLSGAAPVVQGFAALLVLAGITLGVWFQRTRYPWLFMGWLWFLGTLVPVIGLVQVGRQSMADRYTYIPHIGLFVAIVWTLAERLSGRVQPRVAFGTAAAALAACAALTVTQLSHWRDSIALFSHALEVTEDNSFTRNNLGVALSMAGYHEAAIPHYRAAIALEPNLAEAHRNLGFEMNQFGRYRQARYHLERALQFGREHPLIHEQLALALASLGEAPRASEHRQRAAQLAAGGGR
jgi:hypothetical protein